MFAQLNTVYAILLRPTRWLRKQLHRQMNRWVLPLWFPDRQDAALKTGKFYTRTGSCNGCGACCEGLLLTYRGQPITDIHSFEKLKQHFSDYEAFIPQTQTEHGLTFNCAYLTPEKQCGQYATRPVFCRRYPTEETLLNGGQLPTECSYLFTARKPFNHYLAGDQTSAFIKQDQGPQLTPPVLS